MTGILLLMVIGVFIYVLNVNDNLSREIARLKDQLKTLEGQFFKLRGSSPVSEPPHEPKQEPEARPKSSTPVFQEPPTVPKPPAPVGKIDLTPKPSGKPIAASPLLPSAQSPVRTSPPIDWESFLGVKLFAWLGGFALFLGAAFFVKYSIDHNLISPMMRIIIGMLVGVGAIIGGLLLQRRNLDVTVQTLCAAGVSILYADIYACRSLYGFVSVEGAFALMVLVTITSFLLADRLNSKYVAVLGLIGGFLTPPMLSTGVDRPIALFSYIALLDIGLAAVAMKKRWAFLINMAGAATLLMEFGWAMKFFTPAKAEMAAGIYVLFSLFYVCTSLIAKAQGNEHDDIHLPAGFMPVLTMGFVGHMLTYSALAQRPAFVLGFLLLQSVQLAYVAFQRESLRGFYVAGGSISFLLLAAWTSSRLTPDLLTPALAIYFAFGVVHMAFPILLQKLKPTQSPFLWGYASPILMLILVLIGMVSCSLLSFMIWPVVLILGFMGVMGAWLLGSVLTAIVTFVLVLGSFGIWMLRLPDVSGLSGILLLLGFFACAFFAWALLMTGKRLTVNSKRWGIEPVKAMSMDEAQMLPAMSAAMPFFLIMAVCMKLQLPNPSEVFGLMSLLIVLLLALVRYRANEALALIALVCTAVVEYIWIGRSLTVTNPHLALAWVGGFYGAFLIFPFLFERHLKTLSPWTASVLSGLIHFPILWIVLEKLITREWMAVLPAILAVPLLLGLMHLVKTAKDQNRLSQLAWFGGVALFFITLILPIQFKNEWLTLGLALEGVALLWLYGRVPHDGLKAWALVLLVVSFARLALNPAVLSYHPRAAVPFMNWYLLVYSVTAACCWIGAQLCKPPKHLFMETDVRGMLNAGGAILVFLLLNIEIADFYSTGQAITFNFSGNLAQDMTYSLAWAVFAITMLIVGIRQSSTHTRYASLALLVVSIGKVFSHDIWRLGGLFRVGSFVGLAVTLMLVSFLYQKYLSKENVR